MLKQTNLQEELFNRIDAHLKQDGIHTTIIPSLYFNRQSTITGPVYEIFKPALCITVQGVKDIWLAQEHFRYTPSDYIVTSINLPIIGQVVQATSEQPYLSLKLEFTPKEIIEVLSSIEEHMISIQRNTSAIFVSRLETTLLEAVCRLVRLLDYPIDIPMLAPLIKKEILYRILQSQHSGTLKQLALEGSSAHRIQGIIEYLIGNYDKPLRIETMAEMANMSNATFHRHFKEITSMSPLQFQKQLRLQAARRLLLSESADSAEVAFRVGYESPSQFSREYARMFGRPPKEDLKNMMISHDVQKGNLS